MSKASIRSISFRDADRPITTRRDDLLGRATLSNRLADGIFGWSGVESIVVGLHGGWGSGKSSILNMALERLDEISAESEDGSRVTVVRFNPWTYSSSEQTVLAFFGLLRRVLGGTDASEAAKKAAAGLRAYSLALVPIQLGLGLINPEARGLVKSARAFFDRGRKAVEELADLAARDTEALKAEISQLLAEDGRVIVVIMDDIDRLSHEEVRHLFQLVKTNADFSHLVYLIAFDPQTVSKALEPVYGPNYLEKIVQVQVQVPEPRREAILDALYDRLQEIRDALGADYSREAFLNVFLRGPDGWFRNMRDVSRYLNAVEFSLPAVKDEVNIPEFLCIEAVRILRPDTYSAIQEFQGYLLNQRGDPPGAESSWFTEFKAACGDEWESTERVLQYLFPGVEQAKVTGSMHWTDEDEAEWLARKRVRSSDYFSHYFHFSLHQDELSDAEFEEAFALITDYDGVLGKVTALAEAGKLSSWLRRAHARAADTSEPAAAAKVLLRLGEMTEPRSTMTTLVLAVGAMFGSIEPSARVEVIESAIQARYDAEVVDRLIEQERQETRRQPVSPEVLEKLQESLLGILEEDVGRGLLLKRSHFPEICWLLFNHGKKALVSRALSEALAERETIPLVLEAIVTDSVRSQYGSLFGKWQPRLASQAHELVDLTAVQARLRALPESDIDTFAERHQRMISYLLQLRVAEDGTTVHVDDEK